MKLRLSGRQLYYKEIPTQGFSCEYCEVFRNTYFEKHLRTTAFEYKVLFQILVLKWLQPCLNIFDLLNMLVILVMVSKFCIQF